MPIEQISVSCFTIFVSFQVTSSGVTSGVTFGVTSGLSRRSVFAPAAALLGVRGFVDPLRRLEVLLARGAVLAVTTRRRGRQPGQRRERHVQLKRRRVDVVAGVG